MSLNPMKRIKDRLKKLENTLGIDDESDGIIIVPPGDGEEERAIERFYARYPNYKGTLIILREK